MVDLQPIVELKINGYPEAVQSITWCFRGELFTAPARGTAAEVRQEFQTTPIRQLQSEALDRRPAPAGWLVEAIEQREAPGLVRLVAVGAGVGSIIFEGREAPSAAQLEALRRQAIGSTFAELLPALPPLQRNTR